MESACASCHTRQFGLNTNNQLRGFDPKNNNITAQTDITPGGAPKQMADVVVSCLTETDG